ncbi:OmpA family protein [Portibacter marinus]|uniref:OmpA family protein n=1 Tax=Portibacter marinus TaxID=2898660 RepID=UPI001F186D40|nr:OmpA family protein [Portibacter marinus]
MNFFSAFYILFFLLLGVYANGQQEVIYLKNPSFEGVPRAGATSYEGISAAGWIDCGGIRFPDETPPDIHPGNFFRVKKAPQDGKTYIGLVARDNESWESVSQLLSEPMKANQCYEFDLYMARSDNYVNRMFDIETFSSDEIKSQSEALVLRVYGGLRPCEKKQLLAESELVSNTDWKNFKFNFEANSNLYYITFEAFYKTPVLLPYNGNLLIDNISPIRQIACPGEEPIIAETPPPPPPRTEVKTQPKADPVEPEIAKQEVTEIPTRPEKKEKLITQELNNRVVAGQTIKINNLYFEADTSSINEESYEALEELFDFLQENPGVRIEIGGHTNGIPLPEYCDRLSTARAKEVAEYIIRKGVKPSRVEYKGYGKRKPIATNKTKEGRRRNQRVEITILNVN